MFGQFGSTISDALTTEFFQWFHLDKTGESAAGELTDHTYQPTAPKFHELVRITLTADGAGQLHGVKLSVLRSFIDSAKDFTMAADISKSFLAAALNREDFPAMQEAMTQIRHYQPAESHMTAQPFTAKAGDKQSQDEAFEAMKRAIAAGEPVYATMKTFKREGSRLVPSDDPTPEAPLPGEGEPSYLTYGGKRRQLEQKLSTLTLRMANGNVDGAERLTISVS